METHVTVTNAGLTRLATPINVKNCEVAVTRLVLPKAYYNFKDQTIKVYTAEGWIQRGFPGAHYKSLQSIVEMIDHVIGKDHFNISFDAERLIIAFKAKTNRIRMELPEQLADALNVPRIVRGTMVSSQPVYIMKQYMFINVDFIDAQVLNNTSMSFLYVAHEHSSLQYVKQPVYSRVNKEILDTLNVSIVDQNNKPINFMTGTILVSLHFRKCT